MKKIKEIYENRISAWAKYSGYRIIKRHGQDYIAPDENAVRVWYDPVTGKCIQNDKKAMQERKQWK